MTAAAVGPPFGRRVQGPLARTATAGVLPLRKPDESILPVAGSFPPERTRAALSRQQVIE
eukprot:16448096-Heterocapsa_arctica.AAC.1